MPIDDALTGKIIECAMKVHRTMGPGFLESVYENALAHELRKAGLEVACQVPIPVRYDGIVVGDFTFDMLIAGQVIIENKAVLNLTGTHETQVVNYLTATSIDIGLLINFGAPSLQYKRKYRRYSKQK